MGMSATAIRKAINTAFGEIEVIYEPHRGWGRDYLCRALDAATEGEKEHTRFGTRMFCRKPRQAQPQAVRARYFVLKWTLEGPTNKLDNPASWEEIMSVRADCQWSWALRDCLRLNPHAATAQAFDRWREEWAPIVLGIDYAVDLSGD